MEIKEKSKIRKVFSLKVAVELRKKGFYILGTEPNIHKPWLNVYLFEDSEKFNEEFLKLTSKSKQE